MDFNAWSKAFFVFGAADEFLAAADACNRVTQEQFAKRLSADIDLDDIAKLQRFPAVPIIVNTAFAAELYLKCLHLITVGRWIRGHELKGLFHAIPPLIQDRVRDHYIAQAGDVFSERVGLANGNKVAAFEAVLDEVNMAFDDGRYLFEMFERIPPVRVTMHRELATAARRVILESEPKISYASEPACPPP